MKSIDSMSFSEYVPEHEHAYLYDLINNLLTAGPVSVNDGEDNILIESTDANEISMSLGSTGEDLLHVKGLGTVYLIYNNGSDNDPGVVVADLYTQTLYELDSLGKYIPEAEEYETDY